MLDKVIEFIGVLRKNGVRISMSENLDALEAVRLMGVRDRNDFKNVLRTTLVKAGRDIPVFDELFNIYFSGLGQVLKEGMNGASSSIFMSKEEFEKAMKDLME